MYLPSIPCLLLNSSWYRDGHPGYVAPYDGVRILQTEEAHVPLMDIPGFEIWSQQKLATGESESLIAHLKATTIWLLPAEVETVSESEFEEFLEDLKASLAEG